MAPGPTSFFRPWALRTSTGQLHVSARLLWSQFVGGQLSSLEPLEGEQLHTPPPTPRCFPAFSGGVVLGQERAGCDA